MVFNEVTFLQLHFYFKAQIFLNKHVVHCAGTSSFYNYNYSADDMLHPSEKKQQDK